MNNVNNDNNAEHAVESSILRGTVTIVVIGIVAKLAAFLSEVILAANLGTTYLSDAYYMVSSIKNVLFPMLGIGIWTVFLPIYKEKMTTGKMQEANKLTDQSISIFTLASVILVMVLIIFADGVVSLIAPGFEGETKRLCVELVRISAPLYIFITMSAVYSCILQSHEKFLGSQIREVASYIPTIIAAIFFYRFFGVKALAVALALGGALRLLVELPFVDWGYRYRPDFNIKNESFRLILKRLPSALISEGVVRLNSLVDKIMASTLPEGTVSGLNYGVKLMNVLSGFLSSSISTAVYPQMVAMITLKKYDELSKLMVKIINIFSILMVPVTIASVLFRKEIVSAAFERGAFNHDSVLLTSGVFALYSAGIFFIATNTLINNLFFSFGDTKTPMYVSIVNLTVNISLNLCFIRIWGAFGLAAATSLSAFVTFIIRMISIRKHIRLNYRAMILNYIKITVISVIVCTLPRFVFNNVTVNSFVVLLGSVLMAVPVYFILLKLIRIRELDDLAAIVLRKIKRSKRSYTNS